MMKEKASVVAIGIKSVWIEKAQHSACSACQMKCADGNGAAKLELGNQDVASGLKLLPGDEVWVGIDDKAFVYSLFCIYLIPLLFLLAASLIGQFLFATPVLGGFVGFSLCLIVLKMSRVFERLGFKPFVMGKID